MSFGDFDGCLRVNASGQFSGQYCLLEISQVDEYIKSKLFYSVFRDDKLMQILMSNATSLSSSVVVKTSVCIPSTCSRKDLEAVLDTVTMTKEIGLKIAVPSCEVHKTYQFVTSDIIAGSILGLVGLLFISGTVLDITIRLKKKKDESDRTSLRIPARLLLCFSAVSNTKELVHIGHGSIFLFDLFKFFFPFLVVVTHCYILPMVNDITGPSLNVRDFLTNKLFLILMHNGTGIDQFMFVTAYVLAYSTSKEGKSAARPHIKILRRYFRLIPPTAMVIMMAFIIPQMGSGPMWNVLINNNLATCRRTWWANLALFNNYLPLMDTCMSWLWYVTVDIHLFTLGVLVLELIKRYPCTKIPLFVIGLSMSIGAIIWNNEEYNMDFFENYSLMLDKQKFALFGASTFAFTHLHGIPYCFGIFLGLLVASRPAMKSPFIVSVLGWLSVFAQVFMGLFLYHWYQGNIPSPTIFRFQLCANRLVSVAAIAWVLFYFASNKQNKENQNKGKSKQGEGMKAFRVVAIVLGRLAFMVYLIHPLIIFMNVFSSRTVLYADHRTLMFLFCGVLIVSYAAAVPCYLLFDAPFLALSKIMFPKNLPKKPFPLENNGVLKEINGTYNAGFEKGDLVHNSAVRV